MKKFWLVGLFVFVLGLSLIAVSCSKDEEETPPTVPPSSVFSMNFSNFDTTGALLRTTMDSTRCPHFDTAVVVVTVWSVITQALFILPQLAFVLAASQQPVYEGDKKWRWTFGNVQSNNISLYGTIVSDSVLWEMKVTNQDISDFLWYDGKCDLNALGGWWRLNQDDGTHNEEPALWVKWQRASQQQRASLLLANIIQGDANYGDSVSYVISGSIATASFKDVGSPRDGRWTITWDTTMHYGSIMYPESTESCWDDSFDCIDCDSIPVK